MPRLLALLLLALLLTVPGLHGQMLPTARADEGEAADEEAKEVARLKAEMMLRARVASAVDRGVTWLKTRRQKDGALMLPFVQPKLPKGVEMPPSMPGADGHRFGKTALGALTLAHCGVSAESSTLRAALDYLRKNHRKVMTKGYGVQGATYAMALFAMALHTYYGLEDAPRNEKANPKRNPRQMQARDHAIVLRIGAWFLSTRVEDGLFSYPRKRVKQPRGLRAPPGVNAFVMRGDLSNTQYALLGLWYATRCGYRADAKELHAIADELMRWQSPKGPAVRRALDPLPAAKGRSTSAAPLTDRARGFAYTPPMSKMVGVARSASMTAGGLSSLLILKAILQEQGALEERAARRLDRSSWDAIAWLSKHYDIAQNTHIVELEEVDPAVRELLEKSGPKFGNAWHYYYLYGLERAMVIAGKRYLGTHDWWIDGARLLLGAQQKDGSFGPPADPVQRFGGYDPLLDTCFALLFLQRATLRPRSPLLKVHAEADDGE